MRSIRGAVAAVVTGAAALGAVVFVPSAQGAGSVRSAVSLSAPASGVYGSTIKLTGKVSRAGTTTGLSGATVVLQRSIHGKGKYGNLRSTRAASNGVFTFGVSQTSAYDYRVYYAGSATYARAYSPARYPVVNRYLALDTIVTTDAKAGKLTVTGQARPAPPNGTVVYLQRYSTDARVWVNIATGLTSSGKVTVSAIRPGSVTAYRLVTAARSPYGPGVSATRSFTHYVWRGAFTKSPLEVLSGGPNDLRLHPLDPSKSTLQLTTSQGQVGPHLSLNDEGCIQARSHTALIEAPTEVVGVYLTASGQVRYGSVLAGNHGEVTLAIDLKGGTGLRYYHTSTAKTTTTVEIKVLCSN